jgi:hypothetical protein
MKLWRVSHQEPVGIYWMLARLHMVWLFRWLEYHRYRRIFKGHGTVSRGIDGSIVINITEA